MAVHLISGRILSASLAASLVVSLIASLVVSVGAAAPARADHYLTHPASQSVGKSAGPNAATLVAQAATQAGKRGAVRKIAKSSTAGASSRAARLFKGGTEIKIERDANVYITAPNIPKNDRLLEVYNADRPNHGRFQTRFGEATAVPGLLGIANQTHRATDPNGRNERVYTLADAMRDAIWRKNTAARLKSLTISQSACAGGTAKKAPSIGLVGGC